LAEEEQAVELSGDEEEEKKPVFVITKIEKGDAAEEMKDEGKGSGDEV